MKKYRSLILGLGLILCLTGCKDSAEDHDESSVAVSFENIEGSEGENEASNMEVNVAGNNTDASSDEVSTSESDDNQKENDNQKANDNQEIYDEFLAGKISAVGTFEGSQYEVWFNELPQDPEEWDSYKVSDEMIDIDNDGEYELVINGPYGGMYIDARDGGAYVLAQGEGTTGELGYVEYEGKTYITHRDVSHGGRQVYWFDQYNGSGEVVDSFELSAEYWNNADDHYDSDSDFSFRGEKITMEEYEKILKEILGF